MEGGPKFEGCIDCSHRAQPTAPSQRAYGSLWWPSRAQNTAGFRASRTIGFCPSQDVMGITKRSILFGFE